MSVVIGITLLTFFSCREKVTEPHTQSIQLSAEDVGVTEVWLHLQATPYAEPTVFTLLRDNRPIFSTLQTTLDTLLTDDSLLPNHTYRYTANRTVNVWMQETTMISVHTMDTTSHDFTWKIDTLGDGNSSILRDVAIINDTLVYAVGEINVKDSLGNWQRPPYNIARWDGQRWKLQTVNFTWDFGSGYSEVVTIFAFDAQNIVMSSGGSVMYWNGQVWRNLGYLCQGTNCIGNVYKIWGRSVNDFYGVGRNGSIVHWDGSTWQKIESGTDLDVYDVWGDQNPTYGEYEVYAVAAKQFVTFEKKIMRVTPSGVTVMPDSGIPYNIHGVWFKPGVQYYVVGSGMYHKRNPMQPGPWIGIPASVTQYGIYKIRGNNINDIFVCGAFGELLHFNGMSWKSYRNLTTITLGAFYGINFKHDLVVAVGQESPRAIIAMGKGKVR